MSKAIDKFIKWCDETRVPYDIVSALEDEAYAISETQWNDCNKRYMKGELDDIDYCACLQLIIAEYEQRPPHYGQD